jgi:hypothetical protein
MYALYHKVHIYLEYHSVCPFVRIGTPPPHLPLPSVPPRNQWVGVHTRQRVRGWESPNSDDWRKKLSTLPTLCSAQTYQSAPVSCVVQFKSVPDRCVPERLFLNDTSLGQYVPWTMRPGLYVPRMMRP